MTSMNISTHLSFEDSLSKHQGCTVNQRLMQSRMEHSKARIQSRTKPCHVLSHSTFFKEGKTSHAQLPTFNSDFANARKLSILGAMLTSHLCRRAKLLSSHVPGRLAFPHSGLRGLSQAEAHGNLRRELRQ